MNTAESPASGASARAAEHVAAVDWEGVEEQLDEHGFAQLPDLLTQSDCAALAASFEQDDLFRSTIEMQRHAYGNGRYRYLAYPLPPLVSTLREALYPPLARVANRWNEQLRIDARYPTSLAEFLARCHAAGQTRPTPLLLHYATGGYNRMHQDVYGELAFPLQVACVLSFPGTDFDGGEFLISEGRPRMQTRTTAINLSFGEGIVFANAVRPVTSTRGHARAAMRHGVSSLLSGERYALGLIFHDAE